MDIVYIAARVLFSLMLVNAGINHFTKLEALTGYAQLRKVPAAKLSVQVSGLVLLLGGLSLILGVWADLGGVVLAAVLAGMAFKMHDFWTQSDPQAKQTEMLNFFRNISMAGAALFMFAVASDGNFGPVLVEALFSEGK